MQLAPAAHVQHRLELRIFTIADDDPVAGDGPYQVVKLGLYGRHVGKNICVVVLQIVQNRNPRAVVNELGPFVEKSRVVFVCLDHVVVRSTPGRHVEIQGHAADQKTRLQSARFKQPGDQAGGRGFAVGPGDCDGAFATQIVFAQPAWPRGKRNALVQHRLHRRVSATQCVANDHQVGSWFQLIGIVALEQPDSRGFELCAHGRIGVLIRPGHRISGALRQQREPTHECAAGAQDVNVHLEKNL